jgi:outer membrane protein assembly factor BamB
MIELTDQSLNPSAQTPVSPPAYPATPRRLWVAVALVSLFWVLFFLVSRIDKPYFYGFLYSMASAALLVLLYSVWWWTNRGLRLSQRFFGFALVVGTGCLVAPLSDRSIWFGLLAVGLPAVLLTWTLWMVFAKFTGVPWSRLGALVVVALTWGYFTLIRVDGVDAELQSEARWRWQATAEEKFLAGRSPGDEIRLSKESAVESGLQQRRGDWIAFRGPERDGVIAGTNIATDWKTSPPHLLWRKRVGPAWSSVIVIGDRLFTQEQRGAQETVVCYQAGTGAELWVHEDAARFSETVSGAGPRATPTFAGDRLYTLGATGILNCLDAATGKCHWSRDTAAEAGAKPPQWGYSSSPLVVENLVLTYAGGEKKKSLLAYKCDSGEPAWTAAAGTDTYSSPQLTILGGRKQCLMLTDQGLFAVDPASGTVLWQTGLAMAGAPRSAQPQRVGDGELVVGSLEGPGVARIKLVREGSAWKAESVWATAQMKPEFPDFVMHQGHLYGFDVSTLCCLDAANGERCWKDGRYGRGQVMLLADQALLLVLTEKGEAILLAADPRRRQELGRFQVLNGKTWNHPVIVHGRLYVRNAEEMACYELAAK